LTGFPSFTTQASAPPQDAAASGPNLSYYLADLQGNKGGVIVHLGCGDNECADDIHGSLCEGIMYEWATERSVRT
jgi:hypothetical protein